MTERHDCDCLVVGGGPAGGALATILTSFGRSVVLVDDGRAKHAIAEETLVPGAARRIEACGLTQVFAEHHFFGVRRQGVIWNSDETAWRDNADHERGLKIERGVFDRALRAHVRELGATVLEGYRARKLPACGHGTVTVESDSGDPVEVEARAIVVATGRGRHSALFPAEVEAKGAATMTFAFNGKTEPPLDDATLIEAVPAGWLWWIPRRGGGTCVAAFVDAAELKDCGHDEIVRHAIANSRGARFEGDLGAPVYGANGTPRLLRPTGGIFVCGDAASIVDALSSQGVEKALASAEDTAHAIDTVLDHPELRPALLAHRHVWERRLWRAHLRQATSWYTSERRFVERPFWQTRQRPDWLASVLGRDTVLQAAAVESRTAVRRSARGFQPVDGMGIVGELTCIATIGSVPVDSLLQLVERPTTVEQAVNRAREQAALFTLTPKAVVDALQMLVDDGFVGAEEG